MTEERAEIVRKNMEKFPAFKVFHSINGYNKQETIFAYKSSGLSYHYLYFPTYGTLANFLTKYNILKYQIANNIPFVCFIEDDLLLHDNFVDYIKNCVGLFTKDINIIRLGTWGEGYITSLQGAINIKNIIDCIGIAQNIDNQLRDLSGPELFCNKTPWSLVVPTNAGDCLKTDKLDVRDLQ